MTEEQMRARIADLERYVSELTFWATDSENFKRVREEARLFLMGDDSADWPRS